MRDPTERLKDMLDAIANIERYAARGREAFERDELIQIWGPLIIALKSTNANPAPLPPRATRCCQRSSPARCG